MAGVEISHTSSRGGELTVNFKGKMYAGNLFDPLVRLVERVLTMQGWSEVGFDTKKGQMRFRPPSGPKGTPTTDDLKALCQEHAATKMTPRFHRVEAQLFTTGNPKTPQEVDCVRRLQVTLVVESSGSLPFANSDASAIERIKGVASARTGDRNRTITVMWYTDGRDPWAEAKPIQAEITQLLS